MKNKIVTHFYVKEARKDSQGLAPIYLRITINGERAELSTNKKIKPEAWDRSSERVAGRTEPARITNSYLDTLNSKVSKYFSNIDVKDDMVSVHQVIAELKGTSQNKMTLVKAYESHITKLDALVGIDYAANTVKRYRSSLNGLKKFMEKILFKEDIRLCDLDNLFIESYDAYLKSNKGLKSNSAAKDIKNLYRVINKAISNKWILLNPFKDFSCNYTNPPRSYLTEEEINTIFKKEFTTRRLARVRDVFIFQIYTGLSYIDMAELTEENIEIGIDGNHWIVIHRKKTGNRSSIPLLPTAQDVLDRYKIDPWCIAEHKLLPICSNQRMNGYLKEIA